MRRAAGFTLMEVLMSVAMLVLLVTITIPIYEKFVRRNDLGLTAETLANTLRRAETYSRAASYSTGWGVHIQSGVVYLFQGASFASRDTNYDETDNLPVSVSASGLSEVVFSRFTGLPTSTGSFTLTSSTNDTKTVTINAKGMVDY